MAIDCPHCTKKIEDAMPKDRFDEVSRERKEFKKRLDEVEPALELATKANGPLQEEVKAWQGKGSAWEQERAIAGSGITDQEGMDFVRSAWSRLPEQGRPALADWLKDTTKLPKGVQAYLPAQGSGGAQSADKGGTKLPASNGGVQPPPGGQGAPSQFTADAISRMSRDEYRQQRAAVHQSLGLPTPPALPKVG